MKVQGTWVQFYPLFVGSCEYAWHKRMHQIICIYVCMHMFMYKCTCICIYPHTHTYLWVQLKLQLLLHTHTHASCYYAYIFTCMHTYPSVRTKVRRFHKCGDLSFPAKVEPIRVLFRRRESGKHVFVCVCLCMCICNCMSTCRFAFYSYAA